MNDNSSSSLLNASLAHYVAEKEKVLAELEICINKPSGDDVVDRVIALFKKLNDAQSTIELISGIIEENKKEKTTLLEQLDNAKKRLEKSTPPPSQIIKEGNDPRPNI